MLALAVFTILIFTAIGTMDSVKSDFYKHCLKTQYYLVDDKIIRCQVE